MKSRFLTWLIVTALLLSISCAASRNSIVLGPVGPQPLPQDELTTTGYLKVYSATEDHQDGDTHYYPHSEYQIFSMDGKRVKTVRNAISIHDEDPALVEVPMGTYTVLAESEHYGTVKVRVIVEPGKLTTVNLESNELSPRSFFTTKGDLVRLPNGSIVGWRAN